VALDIPLVTSLIPRELPVGAECEPEPRDSVALSNESSEKAAAESDAHTHTPIS
jgi:hypothetical protein